MQQDEFAILHEQLKYLNFHICGTNLSSLNFK